MLCIQKNNANIFDRLVLNQGEGWYVYTNFQQNVKSTKTHRTNVIQPKYVNIGSCKYLYLNCGQSRPWTFSTKHSCIIYWRLTAHIFSFYLFFLFNSSCIWSYLIELCLWILYFRGVLFSKCINSISITRHIIIFFLKIQGRCLITCLNIFDRVFDFV